jgi:hypothetical protein
VCFIYCIGRALVKALIERFSRAFGRALCKASYRASIELYVGVQTFVRAINRRDVCGDDHIGSRVDV